jgi:hypothetical protein
MVLTGFKELVLVFQVQVGPDSSANNIFTILANCLIGQGAGELNSILLLPRNSNLSKIQNYELQY